MQLLVAEAILDFEKQFGYSVKVAISINITMSLSLIAVFLCRRMQQSANGDIRSETPIFITYLLRPRKTVCFVDPRPPLLPEVSVNKCFVI